MHSIVFFTTLFWILASCKNPCTLVQIKQGKLCGALVKGNRFEYVSYMGIPYAKPPIGTLRFKNPEPADGWNGIRDATVPGNVYIQIESRTSTTFTGSENGLFINVYVPGNGCPRKKFPVMVFLHGGGFQTGSGTEILYQPANLVQKGVILVTLNYRLGLLGFLCLNLPGAPGNAGLKDQSLALKWVRENIARFGGDKDSVTLFGESAGAASVCYHMLSPMSRGLFHRAIMQSGTCLNPWTNSDRPEETAVAYATKHGFQFQNKQELLEALLSAPASDLVNMTDFTNQDRQFFAPVAEELFDGVESFLNEKPLDAISRGSLEAVPSIVGFNSEEGVVTLPYFKAIEQEIPMNVSEVQGAFVEMMLRRNLNGAQLLQALGMLEQQYFTPDRDHVKSYIDFMSDINFVIGAHRLARTLADTRQPVYCYLFSHHGAYNIFRYIFKYPYKGASHADELIYMFKPETDTFITNGFRGAGLDVPEIVGSEDDLRVAERFAELWTNFAKYGDPTPKITSSVPLQWERVTKEQMNFIEMNQDIQMVVDPLKERMLFWDNFDNLFK